VHAGDDVAVHIALLISSCIMRGYVPDDLCLTTVTPIPKGNNADLSELNNYRGISLSSIICKIIDLVILDRYSYLLNTSDSQFGFKKNRSTGMCILLVKEVIAYYTRDSGSVYCTLLDASKAFDRVNYCKLFGLLIDRKVPPIIVRFLLRLYTGLKTRIVWNGLYSDVFAVRNGVKQGGILSPILFCIYFDVLLCKIAESGLGCHIGMAFLAALAYADDITLLAPTAEAMRSLLHMCDEFACDYDVIFNANKSKCLRLGKSVCHILPTFFIGDNVIDYVEAWPHLGHILTCDQSDAKDIDRCYLSLVKQINEVLCYFGNLNCITKLNLLYAFCSSLYGAELWDMMYSNSEKLTVAWRRALKRIWNVPQRTHSNILYALCNKWRFEDEIIRRQLLFIRRCYVSDSSVVSMVTRFSVNFSRMQSPSGRSIIYGCSKYGLSIDEFFNMPISCYRKTHFFALCKPFEVETWKLNLIIESLMIRDQCLECVAFDSAQIQSMLNFLCCD
jgi:hypothetical protein